MEGQPESTKVLPPNAFRELEHGETYTPVVPADLSPPEVTARSVLVGLIMVFFICLFLYRFAVARWLAPRVGSASS